MVCFLSQLNLASPLERLQNRCSIQHTLRSQLGNGVTVIIVAHRLQTIMDADNIVRLHLCTNLIPFLCLHQITDVLEDTSPNPRCPRSLLALPHRSSSIVPRISSRTNNGCFELWLMGVVTKWLYESNIRPPKTSSSRSSILINLHTVCNQTKSFLDQLANVEAWSNNWPSQTTVSTSIYHNLVLPTCVALLSMFSDQWSPRSVESQRS